MTNKEQALRNIWTDMKGDDIKQQIAVDNLNTYLSWLATAANEAAAKAELALQDYRTRKHHGDRKGMLIDVVAPYRLRNGLNLKYRGYVISETAAHAREWRYEFAHADYDGDEDLRCGRGKTVHECKEQIDEMIFEFPDTDTADDDAAAAAEAKWEADNNR
jgi:hypothetical protein